MYIMDKESRFVGFEIPFLLQLKRKSYAKLIDRFTFKRGNNWLVIHRYHFIHWLNKRQFDIMVVTHLRTIKIIRHIEIKITGKLEDNFSENIKAVDRDDLQGLTPVITGITNILIQGYFIGNWSYSDFTDLKRPWFSNITFLYSQNFPWSAAQYAAPSRKTWASPRA